MGQWLHSGVAKPTERFVADPSSDCTHISSSLAPDGSAAVGWGQSSVVWTQSFVKNSWDEAERQTTGYGGVGVNFKGTQLFAQDAQHVSIVLDAGGGRQIYQGPARGEWEQDNRYLLSQTNASRVEVVYGADGVQLAVWTHADGVYALGYDSDADEWDAEATILPGTDGGTVDRGVASIAASQDGDALVLWIEGPSNSQTLKSSRFKPATGWENTPTTVGTGLANAPLFDAPALVFDGDTFVSAWTAPSAGKLTTFTSRYDLKSGKWSDREPHVSDLGASAVLMPRLGVDAQRNLMLVWAVGSDPFKLVYQRYRAETEEWGAVDSLADIAFVDASFATEGKLPFAMAPNGLAGVLFRTDESDGTQTLKLASFF